MFILYQGILPKTIAKPENICYNYRKQYFWVVQHEQAVLSVFEISEA
jgi:hypothetical protein